MPDDPTRTRSAQAETEVSGTGSGVPGSAGPFIGRYPIDGEIGRGGMGVVYRARDPQLERVLAIKLVQPPPGRPWTDTRLLREARALAKLHHPNVVQIFDVGSLRDAIYLVMPFVGGGTLRDWLRAEPRTWQEVTARFLAAGRGLAAAHAAGLVHRDFKPHNVLLDADGHVFVADFGLVVEEPAAGGAPLIQTAVRGTPAYMAPEQAAGKLVDARADQYSYCVSFWEGLRGRRPSEEETRDQLAPRSAPHADAAGSTHAPDWLLTAIARGLAFSPEARWPSIDALVGDIEARLGRRKNARVRYVIGGIVAALAIGGTAIGTMVGGEPASSSSTSSVTMVTAAADAGVRAELDAAVSKAPDDGVRASAQLDPRAPKKLAGLIACADHLAFADNDQVVFEVPETNGGKLFSSRLSGGRLQPFAGSNPYARPSIDPGLHIDGELAFEPRTRMMAYVDTAGGPVCFRELSSDTARCGERQLRVQRPAFSVDGKSVFVGDANGVWRVDVTTRVETLVAKGDASNGVALSPDGAHLVWASCQRVARITDLSAMPFERKLATDSHVVRVFAGARGLAWINNGPEGHELVTRAMQNETRHPPVGKIQGVAIDPTGANVAVTMENGEPGVHWYSVDSAGSVTLVSGNKDDRDPFWLGDRTILFHRVDRSGTYTVHTADIVRPGVTRQIARSRHVVAMNTRTGEALIERPSNRGKRFSWWNPKTGRVRPVRFEVPDNITTATISPNGTELLLQSDRTPEVFYRVWLLTEDTVEVVRRQDAHRRGNVVAGSAIIGGGEGITAITEYAEGELVVMPLDATK